MPRGGARKGAGRKPKPKPAAPPEQLPARVDAAGKPDAIAVGMLRQIAIYFMGVAVEEQRKGAAGNARLIADALTEARITAAQLAPYESARLLGIKVMQVPAPGADLPLPLAPPLGAEIVQFPIDASAAGRVYRRLIEGLDDEPAPARGNGHAA